VRTTWKQVTIAYPGDTAEEREQHAIAHLAHVMPTAEADGLITSWWFIRKGPWRIRYQPTTPPGADPVGQLLTETTPSTTDIYEPETHAFGGPDAIHTAHTLFHADSHHLITYLQNQPADRRERSLILCTALMHSTGMDLDEQGDVWARTLDARTPALKTQPPPDPNQWKAFTADVRHLLLGTARSHDTWNNWHTAFTNAGHTLRTLRETGKLTRGLRAITAKLVIFHWNRIGLPTTTQAILARAAKEAILGDTVATVNDNVGNPIPI
jgi:thiopeptide-type bacteriocin biosynthesis protein